LNAAFGTQWTLPTPTFGVVVVTAIVLLIVAGLVGVLVTLRTRRRWTKIAFSLGVLSALSACVPL